MNAGAKRRGDDAGKDKNARSAPKRRTQASAAAPRQSGAAAPLTALGVASAPPKKAKRGRSTSNEPPGNGGGGDTVHPTRAPGDLDGGNEGAKTARLPFEASERKAASDSSSGEPPADTVIKTYYSCGGPRSSWEAAATVSAAADELVERRHVDMSAKKLAKKVNKHLRATDPAGGAGFCVPVNGFYWRRGTEIPAEDPPALRAAGGAVFWSPRGHATPCTTA